MKSVARLGDRHECPVHGTNVITTVSTKSTCDGRPIATIGDATTCGAVIISGASALTVDGRRAAIMGARTSHGGIIIEGSAGTASE